MSMIERRGEISVLLHSTLDSSLINSNSILLELNSNSELKLGMIFTMQMLDECRMLQVHHRNDIF